MHNQSDFSPLCGINFPNHLSSVSKLSRCGMVNKQYLQKKVSHFNLKLTWKVFTSKLNIWHRFTYSGVLYKFPAIIFEGQNLFQMCKILRKIAFANLWLSYLRYQKDMYAEVEIPVASNLRPLCDKTLVTFNLVSITVSSDVDVYYFTLVLK